MWMRKLKKFEKCNKASKLAQGVVNSGTDIVENISVKWGKLDNLLQNA